MARVEVVMPKMGESIMEGTVIEWSKNIGDYVEQDETLLEIATDKVDSEVPAPESGYLVEILAEAGETIEVGQPIAIMDTEGDSSAESSGKSEKKAEAEPEPEPDTDHQEEKADSSGEEKEAPQPESAAKPEPEPETEPSSSGANGSQVSTSTRQGTTPPQREGSDGRFFSPLVRSIAKEEGVSQEELDQIEGSGTQGRVTKQDILSYVEQHKSGKQPAAASKPAAETSQTDSASQEALRKPGAKSDSEIHAGEIKVDWPRENVEVIKMDRMRKVIAEHMIKSKQTSAHVTTFAEADVTNLVRFRGKVKDQFEKENGFKLTFTPFFIEATIQALREFPLINASVDGDEILLHRDINYGLAVALGQSGSGGLVVPVIKNAGELNLRGIARQTHELAQKAREKKLSPDDLVGGTFTLTNYGSVGNLMGTPIINQPQVAIFGTGIIEKKPVVKEVDGIDAIVVRHMVYLSMSYDHRIIDGALGGSFVQRVKSLLENFDVNRTL